MKVSPLTRGNGFLTPPLPVLQVFVCRSGSAADTQNISTYISHYLHQHAMEGDGDIDVSTAASLAMQIVYGNKVRLRHGSSISLDICTFHALVVFYSTGDAVAPTVSVTASSSLIHC